MPRALQILAFSLLPLASAFGWGEPHLAITRAALAVLPAWQQERLGAELKPLGDDYCLIPDHVFSDRQNARFAVMESRPTETYLTILHLPARQPENLETLRYFMGKAVEALRADQIGPAARFMGTVCHQIEDYGSPAHTIPGDNMFTLLRQFLPASEAMKDQLMHGPIENGTFAVSIAGYQPRLLGTTVDEASWRLLHRMHEAILNARSTTIPILHALDAGDQDAVTAAQMRAAVFDAQVTADALNTILCLGAQRFDAKANPEEVAIGTFFPLEAENLYFPQKEFSGAPNWGPARSGVILAEGKKAMPLKLHTDAGEKTFADGISGVMGKSLTFLLPKGVYARFTVLAGLHPELGEKGKVEFKISGDGKVLASATVSGTEPARALACDVSGVTELQLTLASKADPKSAYAIWAEPVLAKAK